MVFISKHAHLQGELLAQLDALGEGTDAGVDGAALALKAPAGFPEVGKGNVEDLYELVGLKLRDWALVLREVHVDFNVDHAEVGVADSGVWVRVRSRLFQAEGGEVAGRSKGEK